MYSEPCAKLTTRVTPKISDSPEAIRNSVDALASPFRNCATKLATVLFGGTQLSHFGVARLHLRAVDVPEGGHDALAVLHGEASDVGAHRRLVVDRAIRDAAERRVDLQLLHRLDQLLRVGAARLRDRRRRALHRRVADDRAEPRVVVVLLAVGVEEALVLGRPDLAPGIAGDVPAGRRLVLERIEVFGLAAEEIEHGAVPERAALVALAHELGEVAGEERREDRVGLRVGERLDDGPGFDLPERRRLLGDELDVGL